MAYYMIHAVPSRMWYVNDYLVPSMVKQGINRDNITIYCDDKQEGNLRSFINSFSSCEDSGGTWHLQDDVIISHNFKEVTEAVDFGIVCGFNSRYDGDLPYGAVTVDKMWFSFPCIRIPNKIARDCAYWVDRYMIGNVVYKEYWEKGVNDDWFFRHYVLNYCKKDLAINLKPNIIDHVDYLIGGTVNSKARKIAIIRSNYWEDEYLVEELEKKLENAESTT